MPYFRCESCALSLYSAASNTHCSKCDAPLGKAERSLEATPLPRPLGREHASRMQAPAADIRSSR
jgi:hypothetical protein